MYSGQAWHSLSISETSSEGNGEKDMRKIANQTLTVQKLQWVFRELKIIIDGEMKSSVCAKLTGISSNILPYTLM